MARRSNKQRQRDTAAKYGFTVAEWDPFSGESEEAFYKKLSRRANDRLRALEKASQREDFKGVLNFAYKNAEYDIHHINENNIRFPQSIPRTKSGEVNKMELHRWTNAVTRFLESPTSTVSGVKQIYEQRARTTNARYGTDFTWHDLANYYESAKAQKSDKDYGSKTEVKALGAIQRIANDPEKIQAAKDGRLQLAGDRLTNEVAIQMLNDGLDPDEIFGGR